MGGVLGAEGWGIDRAEEDRFVRLEKRSARVLRLHLNWKRAQYCISYSLAFGVTG